MILVALGLVFLVALAAIGAVTHFVGSWVFPAIVGVVLTVTLIRANDPTVTDAALAFIPLFVFGVVVATVDPGNQSPEFYGAAAQVLPVLFLAAYSMRKRCLQIRSIDWSRFRSCSTSS